MTHKLHALLLIAVIVNFSACKKNNTDTSIPLVTTIDPDQVSSTTAASGGLSVISAAEIIEKGVCWTTSGNVATVSDPRTSDGAGNEGFVSRISNLTPGTRYSLRAYATNKYGTGYGVTRSFSTKTIPEVSTYSTFTVTKTSGICSAEITRGGETLSDTVGFCWSTSSHPVKSNSKVFVSPQPSSSTFTLTMNGLSPNTTYYVRAFATTKFGTGYGNEIRIRTYYGNVTDIDGNVYNTIKIGDKEWMVENLATTHFQDGSAVPSASLSNWSQLSQPAYLNLGDNNDTYNGLPYFRFYNWYAATDIRNIAPEGWHVSDASDWQSLINYLGADSAGYKMKLPGTKYWYNNVSSNETSFSSIGAGYLTLDNSYYKDQNNGQHFWLTDPEIKSASIFAKESVVHITNVDSRCYGYSIRCVKN